MKELLLNTILEAGAILKERYRQPFKIDHKDGVNNLVTEVDQLLEKFIVNKIQSVYPTHGFIGEEYGSIETKEGTYWIIDPIDGTVNFAHHVPIFCISIGVLQNGSLVLGAIYNPISNELFFAEKGKGAFLNDEKINISTQNNLDKAFLVTGFPYHIPSSQVNPLIPFGKLIEREIPIRRLGSAALDLCYVACGRFDGFWEIELNPYDIAAGYLMVQEAGGTITQFDGTPYSVFDRQTLATNGHIHAELQNVINS